MWEPGSLSQYGIARNIFCPVDALNPPVNMAEVMPLVNDRSKRFFQQ